MIPRFYLTFRLHSTNGFPIPNIYRTSSSRTFVRKTGRFRPPSETLKYREVLRSPSNRFSSRLFFGHWQISTRSQKDVDRTFSLEREILAEVLAEPARTQDCPVCAGVLPRLLAEQGFFLTPAGQQDKAPYSALHRSGPVSSINKNNETDCSCQPKRRPGFSWWSRTLTSDKTVTRSGYEPANSDSEPLTRCSALLLSCYHSGLAVIATTPGC